MPLVMMCGLPSSGKTRRSMELKKHLEDVENCTVHVVDDSEYKNGKNTLYSASHYEKEHRGELRSMVQRHISRQDVVILDSLNYIKGFRYELYCTGKYAQTPQCVVYCELSVPRAKQFNSEREETNRYTEEIFDALVQRFEPPQSHQRWDAPLFSVLPEDELPCDVIADVLLRSKPPPPNKSTLPQPVSATNFIHELDKVTQAVVTSVLEAQRTLVPGEDVAVPGAADPVKVNKVLTMGELQRVRRQFIAFTKTHPCDNTDVIANMFVQFLNKTIT